MLALRFPKSFSEKCQSQNIAYRKSVTTDHNK